jgi:hypothetical protein
MRPPGASTEWWRSAPLLIPGEAALARIIDTLDVAIGLLEDDQTICISVADERGRVLASAQLALTPPAF